MFGIEEEVKKDEEDDEGVSAQKINVSPSLSPFSDVVLPCGVCNKLCLK